MRKVALLVPWRIGNTGQLEFCLQLRSDRDTWALFGGGLEKGESFSQACQRETHEELDILLPRQELGCGQTPFELLFHLPLFSLGTRVFLYRCWDDLPAGYQVLEGREGRWWPASALPANMSLMDKLLLRLADLRCRVLSQPAFPSPLRSPAVTIDLEEHFHVSFAAGRAPRRFARRATDLEAVIDELLAFLDGQRVNATFFTVGDLAVRYPALIREIAWHGHEIAAHGLHHDLCAPQSAESFRQDVVENRKILEDLTGRPVLGYRAPSFSWPTAPEQSQRFYEILRDAGYSYSSSVIPAPLIGTPGLPNMPFQPIEGVWEFPLPCWGLPFQGRRGKGSLFPYSGGVFLRLTGRRLASLLLSYHQSHRGFSALYLHPRELSPDGMEGLDDLYLNLVERKLLCLGAKKVRGVFYRLVAEHGGCRLADYLDYLRDGREGATILDDLAVTA